MISLVTPTFVMINRSRSASLPALIPICQKSSAYQAAELSARLTARGLVHKLSNERLVRLIGFLRVGFGALFVGGGVPVPICVFGAGERYGLPVGRDRDRRHGLVSSVLAVAGGELLIQTLIFIFGTDIRTAGSASILISLGIELMGLWRYRDRMRSLKADADSGLLAL